MGARHDAPTLATVAGPMAGILIALLSSAVWGVGDYLGGTRSRTHPVLVVLLISQIAALVTAVVLVLVVGDARPSWGDLAPAIGAGAVGLMGLGAFYRGLAIGAMGIVAPISATGVAVPVIVGLATGDDLGALQAVGLLAAATGIIVVSREGEGGGGADSRQALGLALVAALGFGGWYVGIDAGADASISWALLTARAAEVAVCVVAVAATRTSLAPARTSWPVISLIGVIDITANGLFALASTKGPLSVVSVCGSLYPLVTVVLALVLLRERIGPSQRAGAGLALAGVLLLAAAS